MPEFTEREKYEAILRRDFQRVGSARLEQLIALLGDPPDPLNVPNYYWNELGAALAKEVRPSLEKIFLLSAVGLVSDLGGDKATRRMPIARIPVGSAAINIQWGLVNSAASTWAQDYSFGMVKGINNTSRAKLRQYIPRFYEEQMGMGDLRDLLKPMFGSVRGQAIAETEVTRASVAGELRLVNGLEEQGIEMQPVFQTNRDSLVCPICGPLNGKIVSASLYPPLHVRCRCWLNHVIKQLAKGIEEFELVL